MLLRCDGAHLPVGRQALNDFAYAVAKQRLHAAMNGCVEHVGRSRFGLNELLDGMSSHQEFMQRNTAFEAGPVALFTAAPAK